MYKRPDIPTSLIVKLYTVEHLTCRQIAAHVGITASAVNLRLHWANVDSTAGTWVNRECGYCGSAIKIRRGQARKNRQSYCKAECYYASFHGERYKPWRHGQRLARAIVAQHFQLEARHVVHHEDKDNRNNDRANLRVFASNADHMAYHRGSNVKPIWDGSKLAVD